MVLYHQRRESAREIQRRNESVSGLSDILVIVLPALVIPAISLKQLFDVALYLVIRPQPSRIYYILVVRSLNDPVTMPRVLRDDNLDHQRSAVVCMQTTLEIAVNALGSLQSIDNLDVDQINCLSHYCRV